MKKGGFIMENYDVAILGGNIEAMTAAVYCSRKGIKTVLIDDCEALGEDLDKLKLVHRLKQQAIEQGTHFLNCKVHSLWYKNTPKIIYTENGPLGCKGILLAMGVTHKKLGIPLESMFHGCGLHYHDSCTSSYLKGRVVSVVGKSDLAVSHAITLSALCKQVYLIYPCSNLHCSAEKLEVLKQSPNIIMLPHTIVYSIEHKNKKMTGINIIDKTTGNVGVLDCELIYVSKGDEPNSKLCFPYVLTDKSGFIVTDKNHKTNIDGVYAAGPIRSTVLDESPGSCCPKDANMAATDGAIAAINLIDSLLSS